MAESTRSSVISRARSDATAMKETLRAQQQLLEKLYGELDEEREASASATSEALDMILRLQGEKAVVKMDASHYKRVAEEKIGHAEASIEAFEELVYQKEMEIASLEFEVQAYRHKLMSLGCEGGVDNEFEFQEDQRNRENGGESSTVRRLNSIPPIQFLRASPVLDVIPVIMEESTEKKVAQPGLDLTRKSSVDFACGSGTLDSYLKEQEVRVISDCAEGEQSGNLSSRRVCDQTDRILLSTNFDEVSQGANDSPRLLNVHDVYEVPQTSSDQKHEVSEKLGKKRLEKWISGAENRLTKPDSVVSEGMVVESLVKQGEEKIKGVFKVHGEIKTPCPKDMKMMTVIGHVDCNSQAEIQKLNKRIERLERQGITHEGNGEKQLRLLKDIQSQLQVIQSEMRSLKTEKATPKAKDDVSLASLQEAMLHFWL